MDFGEGSSDTETDQTPSSSADPADSESSDSEAPFEDNREKPLQLAKIYRDSDGNIVPQINHDNLNTVLETCGDLRLSVICVTGEVRSGKSHMANWILEKLRDLEQGNTRAKKNTRFLKGFQSKHSYKPVTKGIWIWSRCFIVDDDDGQLAVLLMDTEGIDDEFTKPDEITAILSISIMFSSITIINTSGIIPHEMFSWISSITGKDQNNFQKLSFLVKDWTRTTLYPYGAAGGKRYLQSLFSRNTSKLNFLATGKKNVECCLLPHIGEKPLGPPFSGKSSDISENFQTQIQKYLKHSLCIEKLEPMKILENDVTAKDFGFLLLEYVDFLQKSFKLGAIMTPEIHFQETAEIVSRYKITTALNEYQITFEKNRQSTPAGFLTEDDFERVSTLARKKALKRFQSIDLSDEKEKLVKAQLDKKLKETLEQQKTSNDAKRKEKTEGSILNAVKTFKEELQSKFPFASQDNDISPNLVFYQESAIQQELETIMQSTNDRFFEEFAVTDLEEKNRLQSRLVELYRPIITETLTQNSENIKNATQNAVSSCHKIFSRYENELKSIMEELPDMNTKTLDKFHGIEMKKAEADFKLLRLGTAEFQSIWLKNLQDKIKQAHQQFRLDLESTSVKVMEVVAKEVSNYQEILLQTRDMSISEITQFHKTKSAAILKNFSNPIPNESPKYNEVQDKLKLDLDATYQSYVESVTALKTQLDELCTQAITRFENEIQQNIMSQDILNAEDFQKILDGVSKHIFYWFDIETQNSNASSESISQAKRAIFSEFEIIKEKYVANNNTKITNITNLVAQLIQECTQKYDVHMKQEILNKNSREELLLEHESAKTAIIEIFTSQCPTTNRIFLSEQTDILEAKIMKLFPEIQGKFEVAQTAVNVEFSKALFKASQIYQENMEKFFASNTKGFFIEQDLIDKDSAVQKSVFDKLTKENPLTQHVISKLEQELKKLFNKYQDKNELNRISYYDEEPAIGIDLGTTYCCVAVYHKGSVKTILNPNGSNITPSYVTIQADGSTPEVGQTAKERAYKNPESTIFDAKRIIGRRFNDEKFQEDKKLWPFCVEEEEGFAKIKVHERYYWPQEISAMILKRLKKDAEEFLGKKVEKAVITVPAYFTDGQRLATIDAGEIAGLKVLAILNEPTAAAVAYRLEFFVPGTSRKVLVYDLGGGTFDVAILEMTEEKIEILSVDGDSHLGGEDFDKDLMEYSAKEFQNETGINLFKNMNHNAKQKRDEARRCVKRLQLACENAKRSFTSSRTAALSLDEIVKGQDLNLDITRETFYKRNITLFESTIEIVDRALRSAGIRNDEIDDIVMVGGSTRVPKLQEMLKKHFPGKTLMKNVNPDEAVAVGAAVQAAILNAKPGAKIFDFGQIQEVTPMSLGIKIATNEMDVLIPKNTKIPTKFTKQYATHQSGQSGVSISIFQGQEKMAEDNTLLGTFKLDGIPPNTTEKETVEVTMKVNLNGILEVEALCKSNNVKSSITVSAENRGLSQKKKAELLAELPP